MNFLWWIVIFFVVLIVIGFIKAISESNESDRKKNELLDEINKISDFSVTNHFASMDGSSCIAIDENNKKLCFIKRTHILNPLIVNYKDVLSSEIIEDGESITKTSRTSQIGGALLGGVLLGGVGAVIGGLSGSKSTSGKVKSICLRVVVNNTDNPDHYISFLTIEVKKDHPLYKTTIDMARKWQSIVNILIHQADLHDEENEATQHEIKPVEHQSNISELEKLADLKSKGILTDEEFNTEKKKILSR